MRPKYSCINADGIQILNCEQEQFCDFNTRKNITEFSIMFNSDAYIRNWISQLSLDCTPTRVTDNLILTYFIGQVCGLLLFSWISDRFGRRIHLLSSIAAQIPFLITVLLSNSLTLTFFMYFFMGLCYVGRYNGTFVSIVEHAPSRWKNELQSMLLIVDVSH